MERRIVHCPTDEVTINKEARSARQSQLGPFILVFFYIGCFFRRIQTFVELVRVEAERHCVLLQVRSVKLLVMKKHIVVFPEFALLPSASRSLGCLFGMRMHR